MRDIDRIVYDLLKQIPKGKLTTYGAIAEALGDKRAARAVGMVLNKNTDLEKYPCFKVVRSNGRIGGYKQGKEEKKSRLKDEGVQIRGDKVLNFKSVFFEDFESEEILKKLRKEQDRVFERLELRDMETEPEKVIGADVAYEKDQAFAAAVVMNDNLKILEETTLRAKVDFPYIPTYFYYREGPIISRVIEDLNEEFDLMFLGSSGILHPRKAGLASFIGLEFRKPTIGITKGLLCGEVKREMGAEEFSQITFEESNVGYAYRPKETVNPIYISPGNLITTAQALFYTKKFIEKHKLPKPLYHTHRRAVEFRKNES